MTAGQIVLAALFAWALVVGFILAVIITGGRKRRPAPPAPRMPSDAPIYDYLARRVVTRAPVHACPPSGAGGIMPCCGRTPFEVRAHRIATDPALVTCMTGSDPRVIPPAQGAAGGAS